MATPEENRERLQEIANRGLQDQLSPDRRARFDEAARRGLINVPQSGPRTSDSFGLNLAREGLQGLTLNTSDEILSGMAALMAAVVDDVPFGQAYDDILGAVQYEQEAFRDENPVASTTAQILGGLITGGYGAAKVAGRQAARELAEGVTRRSAAREVGTQAALGATEGGIAGFAGEDNPEDRATAGIVGAGLGGGLGGGVGAGVRFFRNRANRLRDIREGLERGDTSGELAGFRLEGDFIPADEVEDVARVGGRTIDDVDVTLSGGTRRQLGQDSPEGLGAPQADDVPRGTSQGGGRRRRPRVRRDTVGREAVNQGVDPGMVRLIRVSTPETRRAMREMTRLSQRAQSDRVSRALNRPSDALGQNIVDRLRVVEAARQQAGRDLRAAVSGLRGNPNQARVGSEGGGRAIFNDAIRTFQQELDDLGVKLVRDEDGVTTLDFSGSRIEDIPAAERILNRVVNFMSNPERGNDALAMHEAKQYIDDLVDFGKLAEGLSGRAETIVKNLRYDLNQALKQNFPDYADANRRYAQARQAINDVRDAAGSRIDISDRGAERALGTLARDFTNNNRGRQRTINALNDLDQVARQYRDFNDEIVNLAEYAIELDDLFGRQDRTSFGGEIARSVSQAVRGNMSDVAADVAMEAVRAARGQNQENAYRALFNLLRETGESTGTDLAERGARGVTRGQ